MAQSAGGSPHPPGDGPTITVVSTRTLDRVPLPGGGWAEIPGGPAHYITAALDRLGCAYRVVTGEVARVEVKLTPKGERYLIPELPLIPLPSALACDAVIVSPIMREVDPHAFPAVAGLLAVDVQGFVREPSQLSGSPGPQVDLTDLIERASVVKASAAEVKRLTVASRQALEQTLVLVTQGERGALVRDRGREAFIEGRPVQVHHAIGAGDSYLAAFVHAMLLGAAPVEAGERAARFTEEVLRERPHTRQPSR